MRRTTVAAVALLAVAAIVLIWRLRNRAGADAKESEPPRDDRVSQSGRESMDHTFGKQYRFSKDAPTGLVVGTVMEVSSREVVPGADVVFRQGRDEVTATSGVDGRYSAQLAPGTYRVRAVSEQTVALPQPPLKVGRLEEQLEYDVLVVRLVPVRGRVEYADETPTEGAEVSVRASSTGAREYVETGELPAAETGADGAFTLGVLPGEVELQATDGALHGFAQLTNVTPGSERSGVVIVLQEGATISGVVLDPAGQPIAGAEAYAAVQRPRTMRYDRTSVTTDDAGRFEVRVRSGNTVVVATAEGYADSARRSFATRAGQTREVELTVQEPFTLAGRVVDPSGASVASADVSRLRYRTKLPTQRVTTGPDGVFEFRDVSRGPHVLVAEAEGYGAVRVNDATAPADDIELKLVRYGGLRGAVTGDDGAAVRQFVVKATRAEGVAGSVRSARFSADDGRYELFPIEPGAYDLLVFGPGFAPSRVNDVEVAPGGWAEVSVVLPRAGRVRGTITSARTGKPIHLAKISLGSGHVGAAALTGRDGTFTLADVGSGRRKIWIQHPDYGKHKAIVKVRAGQETVVNRSIEYRCVTCAPE